MQLKKLLLLPRMQLWWQKKMLQIGKRLPRQPNSRLLRKWLKLKPQKRHKKLSFLKNNKIIRRSMMKLWQLKMLHSKPLKIKQKKHKKQLLQLEKHSL
jgi:hypothetical protein